MQNGRKRRRFATRRTVNRYPSATAVFILNGATSHCSFCCHQTRSVKIRIVSRQPRIQQQRPPHGFRKKLLNQQQNHILEKVTLLLFCLEPAPQFEHIYFFLRENKSRTSIHSKRPTISSTFIYSSIERIFDNPVRFEHLTSTGFPDCASSNVT